MSHLPEPLAVTLADRYRLEREVGQGGMATVYLAHDVRHDRKVALKVLRPELSAILGADRFLAEIKTTANLQHPHILSLFDSGEAGGHVFYVMPYVEGESLRVREVADALDYAHRHGVIHRDIKPENILLHDGRAMVADFGIALAASRTNGGSRMTETGMSLGTPHYMSPEQAMGEREITAKSDVYALGCVLYEMLTGEPPFTGPTAQAIIARVMTEEPRSLTIQRKTIPPHVEAAVVTALSKLAADRFATAAQFAEALGRPDMVTAVTAGARHPVTGPRATASRRLLAAAPWVLAVLALSGAAYAWRARQPAPATSWRFIAIGDGLVPTLGAPSLALSPDGQWVAFLADGHVKKIRPGQGGAVVLADSADGTLGGATWLDDGTLVYVGPTFSELSRVSASGGPSSVALRDTSLAGLGLGAPSGLPGARGVLFTVCNSGCVSISVNVLDLRTGRQRVLLPDMVSASYLPTGHPLMVRRDGTALAAPFDLDRLEITGPGVPVLDGVMTFNGAAFLACSRTGRLVYLQGAASGAELEAVRVTREGVVTAIDTAWHGGFNSFALSPDGRRLAIGVGLSTGVLGIWTKQLDRGPFTRLTFGGQDRRPFWSRDGREVGFIRDSLTRRAVFARRTDGSTPDRLVARLAQQTQEAEWSPDGAWIVLRTDNGGAGAGDIIGIRIHGDTTPVPLVASPFTELHPAVSPDGHWLAYTSIESGTNEVYVRPFPATNGGRWQVSNGGGAQARWSSDGRELFYLDAGARLMAAQVRTAPTFEVGEVGPLFDASGFANQGFHNSFDVLPGGRGFVFFRPRTSGAPGSGVALVEADDWFAEVRARTGR